MNSTEEKIGINESPVQILAKLLIELRNAFEAKDYDKAKEINSEIENMISTQIDKGGE